MIDLLAIAAHPDDAELGCSGTLLRHKAAGKKIGIIDLTKGELGTRGSSEQRTLEAEQASKVLGLDIRENLGFADGFFQNDKNHQLELIRVIRTYKPKVILANAITDRHPDHGKAAALIADACFLSGLPRIVTKSGNREQEAWRPTLFHYIQDKYIHPSFVVDISEYMPRKMEAIKAFKTQFFDGASNEPSTYISSPIFLESILARATEFGKSIGARYAEGFTSAKIIGVEDIFSIR